MEQGAAAYLCVPIPIIACHEKGGDDLFIDNVKKTQQGLDNDVHTFWIRGGWINEILPNDDILIYKLLLQVFSNDCHNHPVVITSM